MPYQRRIVKVPSNKPLVERVLDAISKLLKRLFG